MNFFNQGIPLGRWFGITVVLHWTFLVWAFFELSGSKMLDIDALTLGLLFAVVLVHEFGHALSCKAVGGTADHIVLWPLGGIAFVQPPNNPWAWLFSTVCGPLVNAVLWPVFYLACRHLNILDGGDMYFWYRFHTGAERYLGVACYWMWQINRLLLLFNLIPAYPMDGGRMLQELLWLVVGFQKSLMIAGMVGTVAGLSFVVLGLGVESVHIPPPIDLQLGGQGVDMILLIIGALCMMQSFGIYQRSRQLETWRKR
ncbi:MAG TPA: M50 family metallopeptidase [Phycisphaerae bacterium]|nr:M50 family metallopeptidase [Phycisphaerae bacterium]